MCPKDPFLLRYFQMIIWFITCINHLMSLLLLTNTASVRSILDKIQTYWCERPDLRFMWDYTVNGECVIKVIQLSHRARMTTYRNKLKNCFYSCRMFVVLLELPVFLIIVFLFKSSYQFVVYLIFCPWCFWLLGYSVQLWLMLCYTVDLKGSSGQRVEQK